MRPSIHQRSSTGLRKRVALFAGIVLGMASLTPVANAHDRGHDRFGRVIDVHPVYTYVNVRRPHQQCNGRGHSRYNRSAAPLVGGVIGGVIGNRLGAGHNNRRFNRGRDGRRGPGHGNNRRGHGNLGPTVAGAILGAAIGNGIAHSNQRQYGHRGRHCVQSHRTHKERRLDHYKVTYVYNGRRYTTTTYEYPGHRIEVASRGFRHRH